MLMTGKKKKPDKEYSPNWGGNRRGDKAEPKTPRRITDDEWDLIQRLRDGKGDDS